MVATEEIIILATGRIPGTLGWLGTIVAKDVSMCARHGRLVDTYQEV